MSGIFQYYCRDVKVVSQYICVDLFCLKNHQPHGPQSNLLQEVNVNEDIIEIIAQKQVLHLSLIHLLQLLLLLLYIYYCEWNVFYPVN